MCRSVTRWDYKRECDVEILNYDVNRSIVDKQPVRWETTLQRRNLRRSLHEKCVKEKRDEYESAVSVLRGLNEFRKDGTFCDVELRIGERKICAHKIVIAASSPYLAAMISDKSVESDQLEISITEIDAEGLEILIDYMYTGKLNIDSGNANKILSTALILQMKTAQEQCYVFMEDDLNMENWVEYLLFAGKNSIESLRDSSLEKAASQFIYIFPRNEYLKLEFEEFEQLTERLKEVEHVQDLLYPFVMRWIKYSTQTRIKFMEQLLRRLDPLLISPNILHSSKLALTSNPIFSAWATRANSTRANTSRSRHKSPEHILVSRSTDTFQPMQMNIFSQSVPRKIKTLPQSITDGSYVCNGYYVYHQGGRCQGELRNDSYAYHPINAKWLPFIPLQQARADHRSCVLYGRIYSVGGSDGFDALPSVEFIDLLTGQRGFTEPLPRGKERTGLGIHEKSIYVVGGNDRGIACRCMHRFDAREGVWQALSSSPYGVGASSCAVLGENIYTTHPDTMQRYDIRTNAWEKISAKHEKYPQEVFALRNKVFGLFNDHVAKFTPQTGKWENKVTLNCNIPDLHVSTKLLFPDVNQMSPMVRNRFRGHYWSHPW